MSAEHFTPEQIAQRAMENANGFVLGTILYLKDNGHSPQDWARTTGERFASGWDEVRARGHSQRWSRSL